MVNTAANARHPTASARSSKGPKPSHVTNATEGGKGHSDKASSTPRPLAPRLKVIIRRLPPGLTEDELQRALGTEWHAGGERVDWYRFQKGKITQDISKPSIPGRAYLHLTRQEHVNRLSAAVREADFSDAKNTASDSCLIGPPVVEMATYARIPSSKPRKDARQGTIDQDPEFMGFLQGLTDPIAKPAPLENRELDGTKMSSDAVTPLIQFLRDKKANKDKGKDSSAAKNTKQNRQDSKETKTTAGEKPSVKGKSIKDATTSSTSDKKASVSIKADKATREPIRVLNKPSTAANAGKSQKTRNASPASKMQSTAADAPVSTPPPERKQRKVGAEAKSLLQRDLGLGGSGRRRRGEANTANADAGVTNSTPATTSQRQSVEAKETPSPGPAAHDGKSASGPLQVSTKQTASTKGQPAQTAKGAIGDTTKSGSVAASGNQRSSQPKTGSGGSNLSVSPHQAFLKHANASQGITDSSIRSAMTTFGTVEKVEMEKKKGFAYVDFASLGALKKAVAASPVKIGEANVTVMERRVKAKLEKEKATRPSGNATSGQATSNPIRSDDKTGAEPQTPTTPSQTATVTSSSNTAQTNSPGAARTGSDKPHRPRGQRGRGAGRAAQASSVDKTGNSNSQPKSTKPAATKPS